MKLQRQRKGFSMLVAMAVIVIMASLSVMVLNVANKITTETTTQYQREQAALLARSYTEYAIMAVQANGNRNTAGQCIENINGSYGSNPANGNGYQIQVRISYIAEANRLAGCSATRRLMPAGAAIGSDATYRYPYELNILVDTYVRYKLPDDAFNGNNRWHTYHRRTLQRL